MTTAVEGTLFVDPQAVRPAGYCEDCGGAVYARGSVCERCGRRQV